MLRKWGEQVIRSRQYASGFALVTAFFSCFDLPIRWLSAVIIALMVLQNGPKQGLIVTAWAMLPAVAMFCLGQYGISIDFVLYYILALSFAAVLRKYSWINVIQVAGLLGIVGVVIVYFFVPEWQSFLTSQLTARVKELKNFTLFNFRATDIDLWVNYAGLIATGLWAFATLIKNLLILFLARSWQSVIIPMIALQKECIAIRMHYLTSLLLMGLILIGSFFINSALFLNIFIVALVPFFISGLSLLHAISSTKKNGNTFLFIFYLLFIFLSPSLIMLLSLIGWIDSFVNVRKRLVVNDAIIEE